MAEVSEEGLGSKGAVVPMMMMMMMKQKRSTIVSASQIHPSFMPLLSYCRLSRLQLCDGLHSQKFHIAICIPIKRFHG